MIRYEIERELFDGDLQAEDLPQVWNDKYEQYLGIRPANDADVSLQLSRNVNNSIVTYTTHS